MVYGAPVREPIDHVAGVSVVPVAEDLAARVRELVSFGRSQLVRA